VVRPVAMTGCVQHGLCCRRESTSSLEWLHGTQLNHLAWLSCRAPHSTIFCLRLSIPKGTNHVLAVLKSQRFAHRTPQKSSTSWLERWMHVRTSEPTDGWVVDDGEC
jgi:hypothetical protein